MNNNPRKVLLVDEEKLEEILRRIQVVFGIPGELYNVDKTMKELTRSLPKERDEVDPTSPYDIADAYVEGWNDCLEVLEHSFDKPPAREEVEEEVCDHTWVNELDPDGSYAYSYRDGKYLQACSHCPAQRWVEDPKYRGKP